MKAMSVNSHTSVNRPGVLRSCLSMALSAWAGAALLAGCAGTLTSAPPPTVAATGPVSVKVIAINDFHGNLKPPPGGLRIQDPADPKKLITVAAGGAEHMSTLVANLRRKNPNHVFVAAGDLIGATPVLSALFRDEPSVEAMSMMGLEISAVGNHEFDKGSAELLRMQNGGCHPVEGCKGPHPFKGATYQYLAASTVDVRTGKTLLPPYTIRKFEGIPVAFIGLALKDTPNIVVPAGVAGLKFRDEAETVNGLVPEILQQGVKTIVVLIHEGGFPEGNYNECPGISGPIVDIVKKLDKSVGLVVSGHTHRAYNCQIDGRLVTSADKYGTMLSEIDLQLDRATGRLVSAKADNLIVHTDKLAKDPVLTRHIAAYEALAAPLAKRTVGRVRGPLNTSDTGAGESALGRVIADAQLAAMQAANEGGAQIALMNPGGIRAPLIPQPGGVIQYEDIFLVQPFYNQLITVTLTGAQLLETLEQQWVRQPAPRLLQVSRGFFYAWDAKRPIGQRVVPGSATLNGQPIQPTANYRVVMNAFLAQGGDNFTQLKLARDPVVGPMDVDALEQFIAKGGAASMPTEPRIRKVD